MTHTLTAKEQSLAKIFSDDYVFTVPGRIDQVKKRGTVKIAAIGNAAEGGKISSLYPSGKK